VNLWDSATSLQCNYEAKKLFIYINPKFITGTVPQKVLDWLDMKFGEEGVGRGHTKIFDDETFFMTLNSIPRQCT
jgi:hypothetical protein